MDGNYLTAKVATLFRSLFVNAQTPHFAPRGGATYFGLPRNSLGSRQWT